MRALALTLALAGILATAAQAAEVAGVKIPERVRVTPDGPALVLNGAGVRTRFIFSVYVGALYLPSGTADARTAVTRDGPKRVAMHLLRDLTADQLFSAMSDGLKANESTDQLARFEPRVKELEQIFKAVKAARTGDVIYLDYLPGTGTVVTVNGEVKGKVPGEDFYQALLRIWLGGQPADSDLKRAMLGGS